MFADVWQKCTVRFDEVLVFFYIKRKRTEFRELSKFKRKLLQRYDMKNLVTWLQRCIAKGLWSS